MAAYTTIDDPEAYFQTAPLWTGNGSTRSITLGGDTDMQPDLVWIQNRGGTYASPIFDSVRGATKFVETADTNAENTESDSLTGFNSDGFALGADSSSYVNRSSSPNTYAAWCWKAGGSGSSNSEGDITATVSADTTGGFSIMKFTGNGSNSQSIGHALNGTPAFWMIKNLTDDGVDITIYWKGTDRIKLNTTEVMEQNYLMSASSTTLTTPSNAAWVGGVSGKDYIIWAWQQLQGYSQFGNYKGNGNADGTFIYTGFRPAFFMLKSSSAAGEDWRICDNKRDPENVMDRTLKPNTTGAEADADVMDFCSNGVKLRTTDGGVNYSGRTYIYMAFAEAPFVNSEGVPCNAR